MNEIIEIENRLVGKEQPCFIIGEIGSNHNRDKKTIIKLIDACAEAGFDAVKFQLYDAEEAFSKNEMTTDVKLDHLYGVKPWWEVARDVILMPREWFGEMFEYVRQKNLIPLCAIHRKEDAEFLLEFNLAAFKIASIDLHYHHLLKKLIPYQVPFIISTGMAFLSEIEETIRLLERKGCEEAILLHCVSCYPPRPEDTNLRNIITFQTAFEIQVGYSDHSPKIHTSIAAVTLGATVIEKHITLDKTTLGPDHHFALEPKEMIQLAEGIREVEASLGKTKRILSETELDARKMIRRSIVTKVKIKKGETLSIDKIKFARPGTGISPNEYEFIKNRRVNKDIQPEEIIKWEMLEK
jgi:N,N'-diacetyllegionaminate synthase